LEGGAVSDAFNGMSAPQAEYESIKTAKVAIAYCRITPLQSLPS
jgi:hypothetical protein